MARGAATRAQAPALVRQTLDAPSRPLDAATQTTMGHLFERDFSHVRIHDDITADASTHAVDALAYTVGHHVVFGHRRFAPGTATGDRLLAHELTHVVQQDGNVIGPGPPTVAAAAATPSGLGQVGRSVADSGPWPESRAHLQIGRIDDPAEREADAQAERVASLSAGSRGFAGSTGRPVEQTAGDSSTGVAGKVLEASGTPLEPATRASMEARFGHDFRRVRVHADMPGARSASDAGAAAYTLGSHIAFAAGRYAPDTPVGRNLLAHELAHVIKNWNGGGPIRRQPDLQAALAARNWGKAAELLNGTDAGAIDAALAKLPRGTVGSIHAAALEHPGLGPDSAIAKATRPAYLDLNYENEMKRGVWTEAAKFLNGFSDPDIEKRLQKVTDDQLTKIRDGALDNPALGEKSNVAVVATRVASTRKTVVLYAKATSFNDLIGLVRAAEGKLTAAGITAPKDQIHAVRGLFYGTTWSVDFKEEKSPTRNEGFQRFTRPSQDPASSTPQDIQGMLGRSLVDALKSSQDVVDPGGRHIDFGHLIIGLDARFDPALASNINYPVGSGLASINIDLGGTGTELVTWIGDLGGGAASLALKRVGAPGTSASTVFTGSDYGGSINLEGDIAGSVVAAGGPTSVTAPTIAAGKSLSDVLQDYLSPSGAGATWNSRASAFLRMNGGTFDASGALTNRAAIIAAFQAKIEKFSCNYLASRVKDGKATKADAKTAATHVVGTSEEVATAFVDALIDGAKSGATIQATRFPAAKPAGAGACGAQIFAAGLVAP